MKQTGLRHHLRSGLLLTAYTLRKPQLVGYRQDGRVLDQVPRTHPQVTIPFIPDPAGDGTSFKLTGTFLDQVPAGRPERWTRRHSPHLRSGGAPCWVRQSKSRC